MKKLVSIFAAGALVLAVAPTVFAADPNPTCSPTGVGPVAGAVCDTAISFDVSLGTTIQAPASISLGSGFPGELKVAPGGEKTLGWWSNESGKKLQVSMTDLTCTALTGDCITLGSNQTINKDLVDYMVLTQGQGTLAAGNYDLGTNRVIKDDLAPDSREAISTEGFNLQVHVPSVTNGSYTGTLTFAVVS